MDTQHESMVSAYGAWWNSLHPNFLVTTRRTIERGLVGRTYRVEVNGNELNPQEGPRKALAHDDPGEFQDLCFRVSLETPILLDPNFSRDKQFMDVSV